MEFQTSSIPAGWTSDDYDDYIENLNALDRVSVAEFTEDDFFSDRQGTIYNTRFCDGCKLLFIVWVAPTVPIMVYNASVVQGLSQEEVKRDWRNLWYAMYWKITPENEAYTKSSLFEEATKVLEKHIWLFQLGMW